jgi:hypothetical protein
MYAQIDPFAIDKAGNTVVEELIAPIYIREYYARRGIKVNRVDKNLGDYRQQRLYDLTDSYGCRWEVKTDKIALNTGQVFIEAQALEHSEADKYLVFCPLGHVISRISLLEAVQGRSTLQGGDHLVSTGIMVPLEEFEAMCEEVIAL